MSRKPYIKIVYPDASEIAMLLTEAMVRRASGKRVVETESSERESTGQDLFASSLCCVTETSVELTLNLAPEAMDFALATLIAKNLTQLERDQAMAASDSLELDALFSPCAQAAQAPGQALDGDSSADVPSAEREAETQSGEQEAKIEIGKIPDKELRNILTDMIVSMDEGTETADAIDTAVNEINHRAGVIDLQETYKPDPLILKRDIEAIILGSLQDNIPSLEHHSAVVIADDMARRLNLHTQIECNPNRGYDRNCIEIAVATLICAAQEKDWSREDLTAWADHIIAMLNPNDFTHTSEPSYLATKDISMYIAKGEIHLGLKDIDTAKRLSEELHQEAYQERHKDKQVADQAKPAKKTRKKKTAKQEPTWDDVEAEARSLGKDKTDKTDKAETEQDGEIEPGLLNDIETEGEDHAE